MNKIGDLPAHPLLVHAPIVLLPIMALLTVAIVVRPAWRERFGWWVVAGNFAVMLMLFFATQSGEWLEGAQREAGEVSRTLESHAELGEATRNMAGLMWLFTLGLLAVPRFAGTKDNRPGWYKPATMILSGLSVVIAVLAVVWIVRTGHSGASEAWSDALTGG
mgnify:CR=1 FL=1